MDYIFLDLDGTLLWHGKVSEENAEAIRKVQKLGHKVLLNTGRGYGWYKRDIPNNVEFDGLCCGCGSHLILDRETIYSYLMKYEDVAKTLRGLMAYDYDVVVEGAHNGFFFSMEGKGNDLHRGDVEPFLASEEAYDITKMCIVGDYLPHDLPMYGLVQHYYPDYIEGVAEGIMKDTPMQYIEKNFGISRDHMLAIGDSMNDIDMLRYAGKRAVIGHAPHALDDLQPYRTKEEAAGVAEALHHFYGV